MARYHLDSTLADTANLPDTGNLLRPLHKSLSEEALTRRPSRVDNHQVEVRPIGDSSLRVVHSFDAHFDAALHFPSTPAPLHIEEMGRPDSGEMSDGGTSRATMPTQLELAASAPAPQHSMALSGAAKPQAQRSRLVHQGSDTASQTERAQSGNDAASPLPQPPQQQLGQSTLASVNNSLYWNMAGGNSRQAVRAAPVNAVALAMQELQASQWKLSPDKLLIGDRIAVGGCAEVFVGKLEGTVVAIKLLLNVDAGVLERFFQEVSILAALRHPNLLLFMGYTRSPALAMVSEYMHRGSLFKVLRKRKGRLLEPNLQRSIASSVARGMAHLHSRNPPILHLDLKSPNILIDSQWRIKIGDFGLSRLLKGGKKFVTASVESGTPEWMAPEILRTEGGSDKSDVYSYGVVLWVITTGGAPWECMHPMQVVGAVGFQQKQLTWPADVSGEKFLVDLAKRCMSPDPSERPGFVQILEELEEQYAPPGREVTGLSQSVAGSRLALPAKLLEKLSEAPGKAEVAGSLNAKSGPDPTRSDSAEENDGRARGAVPASAGHSQRGTTESKTSPAAGGLQRAFEDSAMQLFQGQTSSETQHSCRQAAQRPQAPTSKDSEGPSPPVSQQQWLPLRQISVPPQAFAHTSSSTVPASGVPAAPADSVRALPAASQQPAPAPSAAPATGSAAPASVADNDAASASVSDSGAAAAQQQQRQQSGQQEPAEAAASASSDLVGPDACGTQGNASPPSPSSPPPPPQQQQQHLHGLTPFEVAAQGSPFSVRSIGGASPTASERAVSIPQPAAAATAVNTGKQQTQAAPAAGGKRNNGADLLHDSAPPLPDALDTLQPAADAAVAQVLEAAAVQPEWTAKADVHPAESAPPVAPEYKSPFETAAELQSAFSLAPLVPPRKGRQRSGSTSAEDPLEQQLKGAQRQPGSGAPAAGVTAAAACEQPITASAVAVDAAAPCASGGLRLPSARASGGSLPPSAAPSTAALRVLSASSEGPSTGKLITACCSLASLPSSEQSVPAAASSWSTGQGSAGGASDAGASSSSSLSKRQLAERLASLKAAQFERLKAATERRHSDSSRSDGRRDERHQGGGHRSGSCSPRSPYGSRGTERFGLLPLRGGDGGGLGSEPSGRRSDSGNDSAWSLDAPSCSGAEQHPAAATANMGQHTPSSVAEELAAAVQANSAMRSSIEYRRGPVSSLGVICEAASVSSSRSTHINEVLASELLQGELGRHSDAAHPDSA